MTTFEELQDIINRNKSKSKTKKQEKNLLEVSGLSESDGQGQPHIEYADEQTDMPLVDQLYKPKNRPLDGSNPTYWD
jgi:hypothetical protein